VLRRHLSNVRAPAEVSVLVDSVTTAARVLRDNPHVAFGTDTTRYPWLPFEPGPTRTIVGAIAFRLWALETLSADPHEHSNVRLAARGWADAHIPLVLHLDGSGAYDDPDALRVLAAQNLEPRCEFIRHVGGLPDIVDRMACFGFAAPPAASASRARAPKDTVSTAETRARSALDALSDLFKKSMPQRCIVRGLTGKALDIARAHADTREYLLQVLAVGLLGAHELATPPHFAARVMIYDMLVCRRLDDDMAILVAMKSVMFHALRECIIEIVHALPPLRKAIEAVYDWDAFRTSTAATMNDARFRIARNFERIAASTGARAPQIEHLAGMACVKAAHVPMRRKPTAASVARIAYDCTEHVLEHAFDAVYGAATPGVIDDAAFVETEFRHAAKAWAALSLPDAVHAIAAHCALEGEAQDAARDLAAMLSEPSKDVMKSRVRAALMRLCKSSGRAFRFLTAALREIVMREAVRIVPLPRGIATMQAEAVGRAAEGADAFGSFRSDGVVPDTYAFCGSCMRFCGFEDAPDRRARDTASRSLGHRRLLTIPDLLEGTVTYTCGIKSDRAAESRRRTMAPDPVLSVTTSDPDLNRARKKRARELRMEAQHAACRATPVTFVNMIGHALELNANSGGAGKMIMLCVQCGQPFVYEPSAVASGAPVCNTCVLLSSAPSREYCVACNTRRPLSSAAAANWKPLRAWDDLPPDARPTWFNDRLNPAQRMRDLLLCPKHANPFVLQSPDMPLSDVLRATRRDPRTGMFSVVGVRYSDGTVVPIERRWASAAKL